MRMTTFILTMKESFTIKVNYKVHDDIYFYQDIDAIENDDTKSDHRDITGEDNDDDEGEPKLPLRER